MDFLEITKRCDDPGGGGLLMGSPHYFDNGDSVMDISLYKYVSILTKLYHLNMCRLSCVNYTLIKLLK